LIDIVKQLDEQKKTMPSGGGVDPPPSNRNSMMDKKTKFSVKFDAPPKTAEVFKNMRSSTTKQNTSRAQSTLRNNNHSFDDDGALDAFMNDNMKGGGAFKINPRFR